MSNNCDGCDYNVADYCIMFDDVLGYEDCVFRSADEECKYSDDSCSFLLQ